MSLSRWRLHVPCQRCFIHGGADGGLPAAKKSYENANPNADPRTRAVKMSGRAKERQRVRNLSSIAMPFRRQDYRAHPDSEDQGRSAIRDRPQRVTGQAEAQHSRQSD